MDEVLHELANVNIYRRFLCNDYFCGNEFNGNTKRIVSAGCNKTI
jgi:hypothetical protein